MKCHIGVDAFTGMVHTCEATAANVSEMEVAPKLLRKDDEVAYGDSSYSALHKRKEILEDENLSKIDFRMNTKKPYRKNVWQDGLAIYWRNYMEYRKSSVRSKVEYVFHIMKNIFGFKKVRYKGLEKTLPSKICCLRSPISICSEKVTFSKIRGSLTKGVVRLNLRKIILKYSNNIIGRSYGRFCGTIATLDIT